jgi:hypothetical protein
MRPISIRFPLAACALAVLLSACGGGDASPPGGFTSRSVGFAVDGYLSGATVVCDTNANGVADTGERSVVTDSSGLYVFDPACGSALIASGGTSADTGLPFQGKLLAPAGATMITPLTSLMIGGASESVLKTMLGLGATATVAGFDPALSSAGSYVNLEAMKRTLVLQQFAQKITEALAGFDATITEASRLALYNQVTTAIAQALAANSGLFAVGTIAEGPAKALIRAAITSVNGAASLPAGVKGLNPDSVAQVMFGAIKSQADNIFGANNASLSSVTRLQQQSSAITTLFSANKASLMAAPSLTTENLAATLTERAAETTLLSFDEPSVAFSGMGQYGGAAPTVVAGPSGGIGKALKISKPAGSAEWAGVYFGMAAIPFADDRKVLTARVYATRANAKIRFKVEASSTDFVEIESDAIPANTWTTVAWKMPGVSSSKAYKTVAITPDFGVATNGYEYYIDEVTLAPKQEILNFATNYTKPADTDFQWLTAEGGQAGAYSGDRDWSWQGVSPPDAPPEMYFGFGLFQSAWGFGMFVNAPQNGVADMSKFKSVSLELGGNPDLFNKTPSPTANVILQSPSVNGCIPEVEQSLVVAGQPVKNYTLQLNAFTLRTACSDATNTVAKILAAGVTSLHVQITGSSLFMPNGGPNPNGLNVGRIIFSN